MNYNNIYTKKNNVFLRDLKKMQLVEMRQKSVSKFDKTHEEVYGLNQVSPTKKSQGDKLFESQLKRHIIRTKAEQLSKNLDNFYTQKLVQQSYDEMYAPSKIPQLSKMKKKNELDSIYSHGARSSLGTIEGERGLLP